MTRKEGIIKRANEPENAKILAIAGSVEKLMRYKYEDYRELCYECFEQPVNMETWLNQTINPEIQ